MAQTIGRNGLDLVRYCEGEVLHVYLDARDLPTVGVGHLIRAADGIKIGDTISKEQSEDFLKRDLEGAIAAVNGCGLDLTQNQFDALTDFAFNAGPWNLRQLVDNADRVPATIAEHFSHYTRAGTVHPRGLKIRRALERDLFEAPDGVMPDGWLMKHADEFTP